MKRQIDGTSRNADDSSPSKKFELAGSVPHYPPSLDFTITHMSLRVVPDFATKTIRCTEQLQVKRISLDNSADTIELDAAELDVSSVTVGNTSCSFKVFGDKVLVSLVQPARHGDIIGLTITYSAKPRKGFYFVSADEKYPNKRTEAWTQGETTESKYWFACIDHPLVKFTSDISVIVPPEYTVISNGSLKERQQLTADGQPAFAHVWSEGRPHPAYLTSVVIGTYAEITGGRGLYYYVPGEFSDDAMRSFERTPEMLKFFEDYFGVKYPYEKYSQVTVQDFVYGGMENSSCTTLTADTLHDQKAHVDFTSDHLVSHELAHQWFGDLVTCRDWSSIWLNEGFATYCEALYWEASRGTDEFLYYVMQTADDYFEEASTRYVRPIVTKTFKHPDDLFDRHTYEKAGVVLHMLRNTVGDLAFRKSVGAYLDRFGDGTAETFDLRRTFELETGRSLEQFFDQWLYRAGHPQLKMQISIEGRNTLRVKVEQTQAEAPFVFSLEVSVMQSQAGQIGKANQKLFVLRIEEKETAFQLPLDSAGIEWVSIDPEFKILKTISIKAPKELLVNQLKGGRTVIERIEAARALAGEPADSVIEALKTAASGDKFWGVAAEAAKALGSTKTQGSYAALRDCVGKVLHPKVSRAVVKAIGEFRKQESFEELAALLERGDSSYFVESEAALALGKSRDRRAPPLLIKALETRSFQNIVAQGAINGLKEFGENKEIADLLVSKSEYGNHHRVREAATFALGRFAEANPGVFLQLVNLLTDRWFRVRINACRALAEAGLVKAIPQLAAVSERDPDHRVRRVAEECILVIRESSKRPAALEHISDDLDRLKSKNLELMQKLDRLEREMR